MFHVNGRGLPYTATMVGCKQVLPGPHLDAESLLDLYVAEGVTVSAGVPTIWLGILQALDRQPGRWQLESILEQHGAVQTDSRYPPGVLRPCKPASNPAKTVPKGQNRVFFRYAKKGLTAKLHGDRRRAGRNQGGTMSYNPTHGARSRLARIGRRVTAIVAECNYAQTRLTSLRNTPDAHLTPEN